MQLKIYISLLLASVLYASNSTDELTPISEAGDVIAIYTNDWGLGAYTGPKLILCIWGDGSIVWSDDSVNGGAPYHTSKLKPETVDKALTKIADSGAFDIPRLGQGNLGTDFKFTTILVRHNGKELKTNSWHELYEDGGKLVAADNGVQSLEGQKRLKFLATQPAEYLHYRLCWTELRFAAANLIPNSGEESQGKPHMRRGKLSWEPEKQK